MMKLLCIRARLALFVALCFYCCASQVSAALTVAAIGNSGPGGNTLSDGITPDPTSPTYDRFLNDPSFIGSSFNWSGVGRGNNGAWATMISPSYFVSANHFNPVNGFGVTDLRFYYTNDPNLPSGFDQYSNVATFDPNNPGQSKGSFSEVGQITTPSGDLWLGKLSTPVSNSVAKYPIVQLPSDSAYGGKQIYVFGLNSPANGGYTTVRLGTNNIDTHMAFDPQHATVANVNVSGTVGAAYTFTYNPNLGGGESVLHVGDSGAPNFVLINGTMPALVGINWFNYPDDLSPNTSGATFVPRYISGLQNAMTGEAPSVVTDAAVKGDFSLNGQLDAADLPTMLNALTDLNGYKSLHGLSDDFLLRMGDIDGDNKITNLDVQPLINLLAAAGSGSGLSAVPEPTTISLAGIGSLLLIGATAKRRQRRISNNSRLLARALAE